MSHAAEFLQSQSGKHTVGMVMASESSQFGEYPTLTVPTVIEGQRLGVIIYLFSSGVTSEHALCLPICVCLGVSASVSDLSNFVRVCGQCMDMCMYALVCEDLLYWCACGDSQKLCRSSLVLQLMNVESLARGDSSLSTSSACQPQYLCTDVKEHILNVLMDFFSSKQLIPLLLQSAWGHCVVKCYYNECST